MENIELWAFNKRNLQDRIRRKGRDIGRFDHINWFIRGSVYDYACNLDIKVFNSYEDGKTDAQDVISSFMYNNKIKPKDRTWTDREFLEWLGSLGYRRGRDESHKV